MQVAINIYNSYFMGALRTLLRANCILSTNTNNFNNKHIKEK